MLQKILSFLKLRLIETLGLTILIFSIFYLFSISTYSPENATLVTPGKTEENIFLNYSFYISDFLMQAFGLSCFLLFINFFVWSWLVIIKKKISNISFKLLFIVIYLCLLTLGTKILYDQSFWLPDNGHGGFLGGYLISYIPLELYKFNSIIGYITISLGLIFFIISLGLKVAEWILVFKNFLLAVLFIITILSIAYLAI